MRRSRVAWELYVDDFVEGVRAGHSCSKIAERLNRTFNLSLTKNSLIGAMRPRSGNMTKDGPLLRAIGEEYAADADEIIAQFRDACKSGEGRAEYGTLRRRTAPAWKKRFTPEQEQAFQELVDEPGARMRFSCGLVVSDEETDEERKCGVVSQHPFCLKHRAEGFRQMAEDLASRVKRIAA